VAVVLFVVVLVNISIFGALGFLAMRNAVRDRSPRIRILSWGFATVCLAFVLGAVTRLLTLAVHEGWIGGTISEFLVSEWMLLQSLAAMAFGVAGLTVLRKVGGPIRRAEQIVGVLSDRFPAATSVSELGLTARELEVLEVIVTGTLSDKDIADALYISPATAATHVKNIMRKADVSSRRDLVLLAGSNAD
jgi:DNA-binding CsgD family transcriptional regulator